MKLLNGSVEVSCSVLPAFYTVNTELIVIKTLAVVINMYSSWLQQNGELTFDF